MNQNQTMIAGVLAGIGASLCCVVPLLLVSLGVGGAWLAYLTAFAPLRPAFLLLALLFLALGFRRLYLTPQACSPDKPCLDAENRVRQRTVFWVVTIPLLGLMLFPWIAPLFF